VVYELNQITKSICLAFNEAHLIYCITGGIAVSLMGEIRTTKDIDFIILLEENQKESIIPILDRAVKLIQSHEDVMVRHGIPIWRHNMLSRDRKKVISIDLILANSDFLKRVLKRRREIRLLGIRTYLIAPEDLIILKLISFRKQDELDIENIIKSDETIDWKYLKEQIDMMKLNRDFIEHLKETFV